MDENDNIETKVIKIGLLGDGMVGKSAICNRFLGLEFTIDTITTIGSDKFEKKIKLKNGKEIKLHYFNNFMGYSRTREISFCCI